MLGLPCAGGVSPQAAPRRVSADPGAAGGSSPCPGIMVMASTGEAGVGPGSPRAQPIRRGRAGGKGRRGAGVAEAKRSCWEESRKAPAEPAEMAPAENTGRGKWRGGPGTWGGAGRCQGWVWQMKGAEAMGDTQLAGFLALWAWRRGERGEKGGNRVPQGCQSWEQPLSPPHSLGTVPHSSLPQFPPPLEGPVGWGSLWGWNQPCPVLAWGMQDRCAHFMAAGTL